jgi:hypothetical protein
MFYSFRSPTVRFEVLKFVLMLLVGEPVRLG